MAVKPLAIQLYTLRDIAQQDCRKMLQIIADIGFVGVEGGGFGGNKPEVVRKWLDELGLKYVAHHAAMPAKENIDQLTAEAEALGTNMLITSSGRKEFETAASRRAFADRLMEACELASGSGMRFGFHNHDWEFGVLDGVTHYDFLLQHVPVMFAEPDIFWATFGKADAGKLLRQYHDRIPLVHVKDGPLDTRTFSAVGEGKVDIRGILSQHDANIVQYLILEIDAVSGDMVEAVKRSYRFLTSKGLAQGKK